MSLLVDDLFSCGHMCWVSKEAKNKISIAKQQMQFGQHLQK